MAASRREAQVRGEGVEREPTLREIDLDERPLGGFGLVPEAPRRTQAPISHRAADAGGAQWRARFDGTRFPSEPRPSPA